MHSVENVRFGKSSRQWNRWRRRVVINSAVALAAAMATVGLVASPARAEYKSGGTVNCASWVFVHTYNHARGEVWHLQSNGGTPQYRQFGTGLDWATRQFNAGYTTITSWSVFGTQQYNPASGARCGSL